MGLIRSFSTLAAWFMLGGVIQAQGPVLQLSEQLTVPGPAATTVSVPTAAPDPVLGRPAPLLTQPVTVSRGTSAPAPAKSNHDYVAVIGFVREPGTYELNPRKSTLGAVLQLCDGLAKEASGSLRVVRNGRSGGQLFVERENPVSSYQLQSNDVIIVEGYAGARGVTARTAEEARSRMDRPRSALTHIAILNLVQRPVVLPIWERRATGRQLLQTLGQSADLANSLQVVSSPRAMMERRRLQIDAADYSLLAGDVLVIGPGLANEGRIPVKLPEPRKSEVKQPLEAANPQGLQAIPQRADANNSAVDAGSNGVRSSVPQPVVSIPQTADLGDSSASTLIPGRSGETSLSGVGITERPQLPRALDNSDGVGVVNDITGQVTPPTNVEIVQGPDEGADESTHIPTASGWNASSIEGESAAVGMDSLPVAGESVVNGDVTNGEISAGATESETEDLVGTTASAGSSRAWTWEKNVAFAIGYVALIVLGLGSLFTWRMVQAGEDAERAERVETTSTESVDPFDALLHNQLKVIDVPVELAERMQVQGRRPEIEPRRVDQAHALRGPHQPMRHGQSTEPAFEFSRYSDSSETFHNGAADTVTEMASAEPESVVASEPAQVDTRPAPPASTNAGVSESFKRNTASRPEDVPETTPKKRLADGIQWRFDVAHTRVDPVEEKPQVETIKAPKIASRKSRPAVSPTASSSPSGGGLSESISSGARASITSGGVETPAVEPKMPVETTLPSDDQPTESSQGDLLDRVLSRVKGTEA